MSGAHAARGLVRGRHRVSRSRAWRLGALVVVAALLAGVGLVAGSVVRAPAARADNGLPGQTYYYDSFRGMLYFPALWPSVYGLEAISAEFDCDYGVDGSAHVTGFRTAPLPYQYSPPFSTAGWPGSFWIMIQCAQTNPRGTGVDVAVPYNIVLRDANTNAVVYSGDNKLSLLAASGMGGGNGATNTHACNSGDPVMCSSGDFWQTFADVAIPGRTPVLAVSRTYNSLSAGVGGPFGFGWVSSLSSSLTVGGGGDITITQGNGSQVTFAPTGSGGFTPAGGQFTSLMSNADGTFTYTVRGRQNYTFNAAGQLTASSDLDGNTVTYGYTGSQVTSMTDLAGRAVTIAYGSNGFVSSVTDPLGRVTVYGYDTSGNLTSSTDPAGHVTHYAYDANHLMLTMTDPNGGTVTNTFDGTGRVLTQTDALGRVTTFAYAGASFSDAGGSTTITDPTGMVTVEAYVNGALTSLTKGFGTPAAATWTYTIDPATLATTAVTDPNGHSSSQTFDAAGNVTSATDADGRTTHTTFDALNDPLTHTDSAGVTTTFTYTATGDVLSSSTPLGSGAVTTSNTYGDPAHAGDVTSSTDPNGHATTLGYDAYGDVSSVTDADGNQSTSTFDADGERLTSVAPDGNVAGCGCAAAYTTTSSYFSNGLLHTVKNPLGGVATTAYDANGNLTSVTDPTGKVTTRVYDAADELTKVTQPDGTYVSYGYDADGRQTSVTDGTRPPTVSTYDALGNVSTVSDPTGATTTNTYDPAGRLTQSQAPNGGVTSYSYDAAGQLLSTTSPTGGVSSSTYDADGRVATSTDADHNTTTFSYDSLGRQTTTQRADGTSTSNGFDNDGNVTSYTDGAGQITRYVFDPAGRQTSSTDADNRTTSFGYDPSGNQTTVTDALGRVTTNTFDAASRLTNVAYSATGTHAVAYTYDAAGRRITMKDATGTTTYSYDAFGRLASVKNGVDVVKYAYNTFGQIATLTYPDGHVVTRGYDNADRLSAVTDWNNNTTTFGYDGDGNQTTTTYPNGVVQATTVDAADQTTAVAINHGSTALASFGYTPDPAGQVSATTDSLAPNLSTSYTYTPLNQLGTVASAAAQYTYDSSGNLTGLTNGATLTYDPAGQLKTQTAPGGFSTSFTFDGVGDRTKAAATSTPMPGTLTPDVNVTADTTTATASGVTTPAFGTTTASELLVALVSAGPGTASKQTVTVSGGGLTWTKRDRVNTKAGDAEIWTAPATAVLTGASVTAVPASAGGKLSLEVLSLVGAAPGVGAKADASGATGAAGVPVTTTGANSLVFGVGYDGTASATTTVGAGQVLMHQLSVAGTTGNSWMQETATAVPAAGTAVNVADTAPTTLAWNLAAAEINAKPIPGPASTTTDAYNQASELTSVATTGATTTKYTYNGDGLRATSATGGVTTTYIWDSQAGVPLLLTDATNDYVYGPDGGVIEQVAKADGTTSYLHTDALGSVRVVTDASGASVGTASFDAYGNVIARTGTTTAFGYAGQYTDPTGLIYLRARMYDPATGQFLTVDPMVDQTKPPYAYVAGDPLNATDPTGLHGAAVNPFSSNFWTKGNFLSNPVQQNLACGNDLLDSLDMAYNPVYLGLQGYSDARDQGNSIGASLIMGFDPAYGGIAHGAAAVDDFNQGHYAAAAGEASQSLLDTAATVGVATGLVGGYGAVAGAVRGAGATEGADAAAVDVGHAGIHQFPGIAAGKSQFFDGADLGQLSNTDGLTGVVQQNGNIRYVLRGAGDVGVDGTSGLPTDIYTVIRKPDGSVLTMFPGTSPKS